MPGNNHRDGSLWRFSLYGTQAGRVRAFSKADITRNLSAHSLKATKMTSLMLKLSVKQHHIIYAFVAQNRISAGNASSASCP
jgi:hypothetical protein